MAWLIEHWFAAALFAAYTALLVLHARAGLRAGTSADGYFVAGRRLGGVVVGISFYATFASTNSYIGHAGKSYEYGVAWAGPWRCCWWSSPGCPGGSWRRA